MKFLKALFAPPKRFLFLFLFLSLSSKAEEIDRSHVQIQRVDRDGKITQIEKIENIGWKFSPHFCLNFSFQDRNLHLSESETWKASEEENIQVSFEDQKVKVCLLSREGEFTLQSSRSRNSFYHYFVEIDEEKPFFAVENACPSEDLKEKSELSGEALAYGMRCRSPVASVPSAPVTSKPSLEVEFLSPRSADLSPHENDRVFTVLDRQDLLVELKNASAHSVGTVSLQYAPPTPTPTPEALIPIVEGDGSLSPSLWLGVNMSSNKMSFSQIPSNDFTASGMQNRIMLSGRFSLASHPGWYIGYLAREEGTSQISLDYRVSALYRWQRTENVHSFVGVGVYGVKMINNLNYGTSDPLAPEILFLLESAKRHWGLSISYAPLGSYSKLLSGSMTEFSAYTRIPFHSLRRFFVRGDYRMINVPASVAGFNAVYDGSQIGLSLGFSIGDNL